MRRSGDAAWFVVVALGGACSSPDTTEAGFISLGRDGSEGGNGAVGAIGSPGPIITPMGGTNTSGTGNVGMGGTIIPGGNAGASTSGQGGTTSANGGTTGVNGGSGTGAACGDDPMPFYGSDPVALYPEIETACEYAGPRSRVCLADGSVWYCGQRNGGIVEQGCPNDSCQSGCCHTPSDPCPNRRVGPDGPYPNDCAGDCGGYGDCMDVPSVAIMLAPNFVHVTRVGPNTATLECGDRSVRYFTLNFDFATFGAHPNARLTVSPPWQLSDTISCDPPVGRCLVVNAAITSRPDFSPGFAVVMTDADSPPARNVMIETSAIPVTCP